MKCHFIYSTRLVGVLNLMMAYRQILARQTTPWRQMLTQGTRSPWRQISCLPTPPCQVEMDARFYPHEIVFRCQKCASLCIFRVLLVEEPRAWLLVRSGPLQCPQWVWETAGDHADPDTSQLHGGYQLRVLVGGPSFQWEKADPLRGLYADKRTVL